jgi:hypothetical protein
MRWRLIRALTLYIPLSLLFLFYLLLYPLPSLVFSANPFLLRLRRDRGRRLSIINFVWVLWLQRFRGLLFLARLDHFRFWLSVLLLLEIIWLFLIISLIIMHEMRIRVWCVGVYTLLLYMTTMFVLVSGLPHFLAVLNVLLSRKEGSSQFGPLLL